MNTGRPWELERLIPPESRSLPGLLRCRGRGRNFGSTQAAIRQLIASLGLQVMTSGTTCTAGVDDLVALIGPARPAQGATLTFSKQRSPGLSRCASHRLTDATFGYFSFMGEVP